MNKLIMTMATVIFLALAAYAEQTNLIEVASGQSQSVWRPTKDEVINGVVFLGEGVYRFNLTGGDFDSVKREFGPMLASFRKNHPKLQLETAVVTRTRPTMPYASACVDYIGIEYLVIFHLKQE